MSVASYRDGECVDTLVDLFRKAARPELVYVGVVTFTAAGDTSSGERCEAPQLEPYEQNIRCVQGVGGEGVGVQGEVVVELWQAGGRGGVGCSAGWASGSRCSLPFPACFRALKAGTRLRLTCFWLFHPPWSWLQLRFFILNHDCNPPPPPTHLRHAPPGAST